MGVQMLHVKGKFDLMTGGGGGGDGGDKNRSLEARGLCSLALKKLELDTALAQNVVFVLQNVFVAKVACLYDPLRQSSSIL